MSSALCEFYCEVCGSLLGAGMEENLYVWNVVLANAGCELLPWLSDEFIGVMSLVMRFESEVC